VLIVIQSNPKSHIIIAAVGMMMMIMIMIMIMMTTTISTEMMIVGLGQ
jgi:hypothetical protein